MNPTTTDTAAGPDKTSQAQDAHTWALRESEERLRLAMMVNNDGLWDWKLTTNEVYFDPRYYLMAGYEVDEFPHRLGEFQQRVHTDDQAEVMAAIQELLNAQSARHEVEFRFRKKDGDYLWILSKWLIVERSEQGKPLRIVGTHSDITQRKQAEEALVQSHQFYRQLLESTKDGVLVCGADSRFILWNPAMERISGVPQEKALGRHPLELFPFLKEQGIWDLFERALAGESVASADYRYETHGSHKSGWAVNEYYPLRDDHGNPVGVIGTVHDITERKQVEDRLRQQHTMLSRTEHIANLGSWEWDIEADHVRWSEELFRIFQRDPARGAPSFAEHPQLFVAEDMDRLRSAVETCLSEGASYELELSHVTPDDRIQQGIARGYPEYDSAGRIIRLVGSYQDITERKQAEAELQHKLAELQQWYEVMLGREGRVLELKHEADALRQRLGEPPRYALELADDLPAIPRREGMRP